MKKELRGKKISFGEEVKDAVSAYFEGEQKSFFFLGYIQKNVLQLQVNRLKKKIWTFIFPPYPLL